MIPKVAVAAPAPPFAIDQPYSEEHGGLEDELIAQAFHSHALFKFDNWEVHQLVEQVIRDNNQDYAATIVSFVGAKNGRGAVLAMKSQHAGKDAWEANIHRSEDFTKNQVWSGTTNTCFLAHAS